MLYSYRCKRYQKLVGSLGHLPSTREKDMAKSIPHVVPRNVIGFFRFPRSCAEIMVDGLKH